MESTYGSHVYGLQPGTYNPYTIGGGKTGGRGGVFVWVD